MARSARPLEIETADGVPTGRWRCVDTSDETDELVPLCGCPTGHASPVEAAECPVVRAVAVLRRQGLRARPTVAELARIAFEAYGVSTGGKTWDGRPIPSFDEVRARTPHVAAAWEAAVRAVLRATGQISGG